MVERTGLENRRTCKRTVGSNPTLSAKHSRKIGFCYNADRAQPGAGLLVKVSAKTQPHIASENLKPPFDIGRCEKRQADEQYEQRAQML